MRITVSMPSTGVVYAPGLARPVVIDTDQLPAKLAAKLTRLVEDPGLFAPPAAPRSPASKQLRDAEELTITVESGGTERTLHISEPAGSIANASLREFVQLVRDQAALQRQKNQP